MEIPTLQEMSVRLEQATAPDRCLDLDIERALTTQLARESDLHAHPDRARPFTASVDAVLGLVREVAPGWRVTFSGTAAETTWVGTFAEVGGYHWRGEPAGYVASSKIDAPALALCIALFRALECKQALRRSAEAA